MSDKPFVIVVGIDYSIHSERTLSAAFEYARRHVAAVLHVTHVARPISNGEGALLVTDPLSLNELKDQLFGHVGSFLHKHDGATVGHRHAR